MIPPKNVLLCPPTHYDVIYKINDFMQPGTVERALAERQWDDLYTTYSSICPRVFCVDSVEGLPDMVFMANQSLPFQRDGENCVILSRMRTRERQPEVAHVGRWFQERGYRCLSLPEEIPCFEGMGDAIWHPGRELLWGGVGLRTCAEAYDFIGSATGCEVRILHTVPPFYHLDMAFQPLDSERALVVPNGLAPESMQRLQEEFRELIPVVDGEEGYPHFAGNSHCVNGLDVVSGGGEGTKRRLESAGFRVHSVDLSEFAKAGGSVFCLKMMVY